MKPPKCVKDIQKHTGCMAALSCFISRLEEKGLSFFKLLKAKEKFEWSDGWRRLTLLLQSSSSFSHPPGPDGAQGR
jgi:hypothetical protein